MLTITVNGKEYVSKKITMKAYEKAVQIQEDMAKVKYEGNESLDVIKKFVDFICDLYNNQFTFDEFWESTDPVDITFIIKEHLTRCLGKLN